VSTLLLSVAFKHSWNSQRGDLTSFLFQSAETMNNT
jgi:hypothetical protein